VVIMQSALPHLRTRMSLQEQRPTTGRTTVLRRRRRLPISILEPPAPTRTTYTAPAV